MKNMDGTDTADKIQQISEHIKAIFEMKKSERISSWILKENLTRLKILISENPDVYQAIDRIYSYLFATYFKHQRPFISAINEKFSMFTDLNLYH